MLSKLHFKRCSWHRVTILLPAERRLWDTGYDCGTRYRSLWTLIAHLSHSIIDDIVVYVDHCSASLSFTLFKVTLFKSSLHFYMKKKINLALSYVLTSCYNLGTKIPISTPLFQRN